MVNCENFPSQLLLLTLGAHAYCVVVVCVCVTTHNCRLTHWNHKTKIPTCSQQYSVRFKFADFPKNASFKSYGVCLPRAAPASKSFFPHEISFYASVEPIATF